MVKHHPDSSTLAEFAASALPPAQSVVLSTHLDFCGACQHDLAQLESLGAAMFEDVSPVDVDPRVLDNVLARLEDVEDDRAVNDASSSTMAWTVKQIRKGNLEQLQWRKVTRSLKIADLGEIDGAAEFSLYHIAEGGSIPQHNHSGAEMTLVLQGGFSDENAEYHAGDFVIREAGDVHAPTALPGSDCICIAVLESPLRFTRWHHRWLSPLLQLRAG